MVARVIERTLYPPIEEHLRSLGFGSIGESSAAGKGFSDVVFSINGHRFVLEIKLDISRLGKRKSWNLSNSSATIVAVASKALKMKAERL